MKSLENSMRMICMIPKLSAKEKRSSSEKRCSIFLLKMTSAGSGVKQIIDAMQSDLSDCKTHSLISF